MQAVSQYLSHVVSEYLSHDVSEYLLQVVLALYRYHVLVHHAAIGPPRSRLVFRPSEKSRMRWPDLRGRESWDWAEQNSLYKKRIPPTRWGRNPSSEWERVGASRAVRLQAVVIVVVVVEYYYYYIIIIVGACVPRTLEDLL